MKEGETTKPAIEMIDLAKAQPMALGSLWIEPAARSVSKSGGGEAILQPRVMQVLVALLRAEGGILSRSDLTAACWNGVVVGEDAINRVMGQLRRLSEGLGEGVFEIETITKVGFRLKSHAIAKPEGVGLKATIKVMGPSICVLPFLNMSGDAEQGYFSDGISEDIITDLSKVSALAVVARNSAFLYRDAQVDVGEVARRFGVSHIVEGSVRKSGERVRISAKLIEASSGAPIWAERWDRDLSDIFAMQDEISRAIVSALRLQLLPEEGRAIAQRGTASPDAYNLYLQARRSYVGCNLADRSRGEAIIRLCRRAVEIDPDFAQAWAMMGAVQAWLSHVHGGDGESGLAASERAIALDETLAEPHATCAKLLAESGKENAALAELKLALGLDPQCYEAQEAAGLVHYRAGRMREAAGHFQIAAGLAEGDFAAPGMAMSAYSALGDPAAARLAARITRERAEKIVRQDPSNSGALGFLVLALGALGEREAALDWIGRALQIDPDNPNMRYNCACALARLGDKAGAIEQLRCVFETTSASFLRHAKADPDLAGLRSEKSYKAIEAAAEARLAALSSAGS